MQEASVFAGAVRTSTVAILANQHPTGAFIASPDFSQYRYCWLRDGSFTAHALDRVGEHLPAARFHEWSVGCLERIGDLMEDVVEDARLGKPLDAQRTPPARFSLDGRVVRDEWPNFQIDGYGIWLWSLKEHLQRSGRPLPGDFEPAVDRVARYLAAIGTRPCFDVWEENGSSVHTATLGCVYAGLVAASEMLEEGGFLTGADAVRTQVLRSARSQGRYQKSRDDEQVDAALLWLCRPFNLVEPRESAFVATVAEIEALLDLDGGIRRFPADTYFGGGAWPVLTASLGWYWASVGERDKAEERARWILERFDPEGHLGEQYGGERRDPDKHREWTKRWGPSARQLIWSHAMFVVLADELQVI